MQRWIAITLILVLLFAGTSAALAQSLTGLDKVEVSIWPEYDHSDVLVIYRVSLPTTAKLPAEVTLRIPSAVGVPFNVANKEADGMLYTLQYTSEVDGEWSNIKFTTPTPEVQLEYYDNHMQISGAQRHFTFRWSSAVPVEVMTVSVQKPLHGSNMKISDFQGQVLPGADNMDYYVTNLGKLAAGTEFEVTFDYDNNTGQLSADNQPLQPAEPLSPQTQGRVTLADALPWILGTLGVVLIFAGVFWVIKQKAQPPARPAGRGRRSRQTGGQADEEDCNACVYCHECGKRSQPGDMFCRTCGARLRHE